MNVSVFAVQCMLKCQHVILCCLNFLQKWHPILKHLWWADHSLPKPTDQGQWHYQAWPKEQQDHWLHQIWCWECCHGDWWKEQGVVLESSRTGRSTRGTFEADMIFLGIPTTHSKMEMRNFNYSAKTFHSVIIMGKWAMKKTMRLITSAHSTTKLILYFYFFFSHYFLHLTYSNPLSCACNPLFHFNSSFFFKYFILFYFFISKFNFPKFQPSNFIFF